MIPAIYRFLPRIAWGDVWTGALVTAVLFTAREAINPSVFHTQPAARAGCSLAEG
jgi:hypothetical protein